MFIVHVRLGDGLGDTVWELHAKTKEDAMEELRKEILGEEFPNDGFETSGHWGNRHIISATLYEVVSIEEMPVETWYKDAENVLSRMIEKELREYKRLKEKFGVEEL